MRWHERVSIRGERIALPLDGPLQEAAWMKVRIARAKQALPNGYCGLLLVQACPHPNASLSGDSFLTDGSFRTVHEQQLEHTRHGETRVAHAGDCVVIPPHVPRGGHAGPQGCTAIDVFTPPRAQAMAR